MTTENPLNSPSRSADPVRKTGAGILVDCLLAQGADTVFCVPGESYLAVLDVLYDHRETVRLISCRQEGGAANMAEAYGKLTGRPGLCFVTRGPGATNAAIGVHTARQDSTPMILFVGQIPRDHRDREAFQEIDYRRMFGGVAKWAAEIEDPGRIPEYVSRAYHMAMNGRPGPVVLALPEDILTEIRDFRVPPRVEPAGAAPSAAAMAAVKAHLDRAERPLMILGGAGWSDAACAHITRFAEANDVPVVSSLRRQDLFDNCHENYVGDLGFAVNPALKARVAEADLILAVGTRLSEVMTGGYTLLEPPLPSAALIHVHPGVEELGKVYAPTVAIPASVTEFAAAMAALEPAAPGRRGTWRADARADYCAWLKPGAAVGAVNMGEVVTHLQSALPDDVIIANDAGNFAIWVHRFFQYRRCHTQLAPTSGAMGYGVPAGIAAKALHPDRTVIVFAGDGCFLMTGQELATAVQYGINVIVVIVNNGMYGTIRMHQERDYPGRVSGTTLKNPDFVRLAEAFGAFGIRVTRTEDFPAALDAACAANRPAVIEIIVDPEDLTPRQSLSAIRAAAQSKTS